MSLSTQHRWYRLFCMNTVLHRSRGLGRETPSRAGLRRVVSAAIARTTGANAAFGHAGTLPTGRRGAHADEDRGRARQNACGVSRSEDPPPPTMVREQLLQAVGDRYARNLGSPIARYRAKVLRGRSRTVLLPVALEAVLLETQKYRKICDHRGQASKWQLAAQNIIPSSVLQKPCSVTTGNHSARAMCEPN